MYVYITFFFFLFCSLRKKDITPMLFFFQMYFSFFLCFKIFAYFRTEKKMFTSVFFLIHDLLVQVEEKCARLTCDIALIFFIRFLQV